MMATMMMAAAVQSPPPKAGAGIKAGRKGTRQSRGGFSIAPDTNSAVTIAKAARESATDAEIEAGLKAAKQDVADEEAEIARLEALRFNDADGKAPQNADGGNDGTVADAEGGGGDGGDGGDGDRAAGKEASTWEDTEDGGAGTSAGESQTPSPKKKKKKRSNSSKPRLPRSSNASKKPPPNPHRSAAALAAAEAVPTKKTKKRKKKRRKKRPPPSTSTHKSSNRTMTHTMPPLGRSLAQWKAPKRNGKMRPLPRIATLGQVGDRDNWRAKYGRFPNAGRSRFDYRAVDRDTKSHSTAMSTSKAQWDTLPLALDFGTSGQRGRPLHKHDFRPLARFNGTIGQWVLRSAGRKKPKLRKPRKKGSVMLADEVKAPPKPPARGLTLLTGLRHRDGRQIHGTGLATFGGKGYIKPLPDSLDFGMALHDKGYTPDFNPLDRKGHSTALTTSKAKAILVPLDIALDTGRAHEPGKLKQDFRELARSPTSHGFGVHTERANEVIVPLPDSLDYGAAAHDGGLLRQDFRLQGKDGARTALATQARGAIEPLPFSLDYGDARVSPI